MKMELKYNISKRMLSIGALGVLLVCTSCLMFICDPLDFIISKVLKLSEGSIFFWLWSAPPIDILLKIYAFNITNGEQFLKGEEKLNVTEIGPYVYREILTNTNATFNNTEGTVTFTPHREFAFDDEKSVGNPKIDKMITTNLPLVGLQAYLNDHSFFTNIAYSTFTKSLGQKPLQELTIDQYMWGYEDKLIEMAHTFVPSWIDFKSFGIFERLMSQDNTNRVKMVIDPSKYHSKTESLLTEEQRMAQYHVAEWNGSPGLKEWGFPNHSIDTEEDITQIKKCSMVEGSFDGTLFPRHIAENRTFSIFRKAFCRPVPMEYINKTVNDNGFKVYNYKLADWMFSPPEERSENECFCHKNKCIKGLQSIGDCYYGIPVTLSQPHFLNADPALATAVNGLKPDVNKHGSICTMQPDIGLPLGGNMRIQINLDVGHTKYNSQTRPFNGLNVPLFWVEITTAELPSTVMLLLTLLLTVLPITLEVIKYLLGLGGLALISGCAALILLNNPKVRIPRGLSISADYSQIPLIHIQNDYCKLEKDNDT